ncbi:MAG: hypothetical protein E4H28_01720 [Gemmatimonadales bacterium]|nr:MAG: hypothetical protein E4H28_01720 [Gemmatimonadales bacterium]
MASNESLLPRGIKRSYLDWDNYATVDEIRLEPPKRPELVVPMPEPSVPVVEPSPTQTIETDVASEVIPEVEIEKEKGEEAESNLESDIHLDPDLEPEAESESPAEVDSELAAEPESEVTSEAAEEPEADSESSVDWDLDVLREEAEEEPESTETDLLDVEFDAGLVEPEEFDLQLDKMAEEFTDIVPELVIESGPGPVLNSASGEGVHEDPISVQPPIASETLPVSEDRDAEKFKYESGRPARKPSRRFLGLVVGFEGESKRRRRMAALAIGGLVVASAMVAGLLSITGGGSTGPKGGIDQATGRTSSQGESDAPIEIPAVASGDSIGDGPVTREQIEDQSQEMLATISRFYGSVVGMDDGTATCADLRAAFVIVEDGWIEYNSRFKAGFPGQLPDDLAARDERLYLGVQDVEREFERSGCPRP